MIIRFTCTCMSQRFWFSCKSCNVISWRTMISSNGNHCQILSFWIAKCKSLNKRWSSLDSSSKTSISESIKLLSLFARSSSKLIPRRIQIQISRRIRMQDVLLLLSSNPPPKQLRCRRDRQVETVTAVSTTTTTIRVDFLHFFKI